MAMSKFWSPTHKIGFGEDHSAEHYTFSPSPFHEGRLTLFTVHDSRGTSVLLGTAVELIPLGIGASAVFAI